MSYSVNNKATHIARRRQASRAKGLKQARAMALMVACPQCGAKPGQPCPRMRTGFHPARNDLAFQRRKTRETP